MNVKYIFSLIIIFFYLFAPRFSFPFSIHTGFLSVLIGFFLFRDNLINAFLDKKILGIGLFFVFLGLYHLIFSFIYKHNPNFIIAILFSVYVSLLFSYAYSVTHVNHENINPLDMLLIIELVVYAICINSAIILLEFYFPQFKNAIESILVNEPTANISYEEHTFRFRGFAASGGASLSVVNAVGIWFAAALSMKNRIKTTTALLIILIICLSNIFTGRTGLMFGLLFTLIFIIQRFLPSLVQSGSKTFIKTAVGLFFLYYILPPIELTDEILEYAFEFFYSIESGSTSTASTDDLKTMLYIPRNPFHFLFGIGFFDGFNNLYERTDSGYLKTLLSFGFIVGLFFYIIMFAFLFLPALVNKELLIFIVPVFLFLLFAEIKEPFLYQNYESRVIMLLAGASLYKLSLSEQDKNDNVSQRIA